ncbi:psbP domain-containing protein 3, chloroplastic isoform X2 [Magnolia sinica]|uniref:psbP domain-containing protein 3, chloroplastic isoform X2 n=1 Tax=Magnolia sinica TaxID=86752 RepID=UPI00265A5E96|nr:psbP domain-containing protein 3, chloroplastic isoform X2 [Magnolia sinica]
MGPKANLQSMASVCSLRLQTTLLRRHRSPSYVSKCRNRSILCFQNIQTDRDSRNGFKEESIRRRRDVLIQFLFCGSSFHSIFAGSASAETDLKEDFRIYSDDSNKFQISIPQEWLVGAGEPNGYKSVTAFYPTEASNSNGLGPDFTRLESFGKVDAFAESLVSGLDRSWQRPPGLAAKLLDSKAGNGLYYIEYSLQNPGESCRHIFSAIGMASNGWYNRLYTVTGQFLEEESEIYRSKIEKSVSSFKLF